MWRMTRLKTGDTENPEDDENRGQENNSRISSDKEIKA